MEDFERSAVPHERTLSWQHISLVYIGVAITIPAFLLVANVALSLGYVQALLAIVLSSIVLSVFGMLSGAVGAKTNLSSYMIIAQVFGEKGGKVINLLFAVTLAGWFGVTLSFFAQAADSIFNWNYQYWLGVGTVLMVLTAIYGFKGLHLFSLVSVPVMLLFLYVFSFFLLKDISFADIVSIKGNENISFGSAVSMLVGGMMVGVAIFPDLTRYTKSVKDGVIAGATSFMSVILFALPIMIPILYYQQDNIVDIVQNTGYTLCALLLIIFASWSSNDNNLYSGALSLVAVFKNISKKVIVLAIAFLGYICSAADITGSFIAFLVFLGAIIPPIAAIYTVDFFIGHYKKYVGEVNRKAVFSWILGGIFAFLTTPEENHGAGVFVLTTIPALDGYLLSGGIYYLFCRYGRH